MSLLLPWGRLFLEGSDSDIDTSDVVKKNTPEMLELSLVSLAAAKCMQLTSACSSPRPGLLCALANRVLPDFFLNPTPVST